jgi:hypothetical protein
MNKLFYILFRNQNRTISMGFLMFALQTTICNAQLSFTESTQILGSSGYACMTGDLNKDGSLDIYIVNCNKPDEIWFNDGRGRFTISEQKVGNSIKYNPNAALADLNGDSLIDLFIANDADWNHAPSTGLSNEVWLNESNGKFTDSGQRLGIMASHDIALGDIDGDGDKDAIVANLHSTDVDNIIYQPNEVWLNDGKGNFTKNEQSLGTGGSAVNLVDIDGDTDLDAVFQIQSNNTFIIWANNGKGIFSESSHTLGTGTNIAFGDLDGDNDMDAFLVKGTPSGNKPCEIWVNNGNGVFSDSGQRLGNLTGYNVVLGDIDKDGDLDAFVTNGIRGAQQSKLWINQGNNQDGTIGNFLESGLVFSSSQIGQAKLDDIDQDGDQDIIVSNYAGGSKIYFNNSIITGLNAIHDGGKSVQIFPNPSSGQTTIKIGDISDEKAFVNIFNTNGCLIYSNTIKNSANFEIDLTNNPKGPYFLRLIVDGEIYNEKVCLIY